MNLRLDSRRRTVGARFVALMSLLATGLTYAADLPDTGISGVYEVMVGTDDLDGTLKYFAEFGFTPVADGQLSAKKAEAKYGVPSALKGVRLQNGAIDTHGLVRVLAW
ncbi:MAG: hypothetical protein AAFU65_16740, partial [Pseudomonadota bacterium]